MEGQITGYDIRIAAAADAFEISLLYHEIYGGMYPDPLMRDVSKLSAFISSGRGLWVVIEKKGKIVGSAVYEVNALHKIARVFGAVVLPSEQRKGLIEKAVALGDKYLIDHLKIVEVVYATTRTATPAPQRVLRKQGYKNLGIFPNVHKTDKYETHCLTAKFANDVLQNKNNRFKLHPGLKSIYSIVQEDCNLPDVPIAPPKTRPHYFTEAGIPPLEIIDASKFVAYRFDALKENREELNNFFPFKKPNLMISSPCQQIELFVSLSQVDKNSTIIGIKYSRKFNFSMILSEASRLLHNHHCRYIEITARVNKLDKIDQILEADFIPCAYFPAFQCFDNTRYDFVFFSKTFEVLNFKNLEFVDFNKDFVMAYYDMWKKRALDTLIDTHEIKPLDNPKNGDEKKEFKSDERKK